MNNNDPFVAPELQQDPQADPFVSPDLQTPSDLTNANNIQGQSGWCQKFVDDAIGTPPQDRVGSADEAWQKYQATGQAVQGTQGIQPGDLLYFSNNHVGIYSGKDKFISATEQDPQHPVKNQSIQAWNDITGDVPLGYVKNPKSLPNIGGINVQ
jgi:hypothetical protein